jgi:hypothetical protein
VCRLLVRPTVRSLLSDCVAVPGTRALFYKRHSLTVRQSHTQPSKTVGETIGRIAREGDEDYPSVRWAGHQLTQHPGERFNVPKRGGANLVRSDRCAKSESKGLNSSTFSRPVLHQCSTDSKESVPR